MPVCDIEEQARSGLAQLRLQLFVGDVSIETARFRLLHSRSKSWPGTLVAGADKLLIAEKDIPTPTLIPMTTPRLDTSQELDSFIGALEKSDLDRVMIVVPRENESEYRFAAPLKVVLSDDFGREALFLGDPLL